MQQVPGTYIGDVEILLRTSVEKTGNFPVKVGLRKESAISPYKFGLIQEVITKEVRDAPP